MWICTECCLVDHLGVEQGHLCYAVSVQSAHFEPVGGNHPSYCLLTPLMSPKDRKYKLN